MFEKANDEQMQAIMTTSGPLLIVAGPGTGKTTTLVHRIVNLVVNENVPISRIMLATFTKKAAREFSRRLQDELAACGCKCNLDEALIGTFHSICERIIREHQEHTVLKKNFTVKEEFEQKYFVYDNMEEFEAIDGFDGLFEDTQQGKWGRSETVCTWVDRLQEELISPERLIASDDVKTSIMGEVLKKYIELREKANFLDFTLMQTEVHRMLRSSPEVRREIVDNIDYVLVDEYQDTNRVQEELTLLLGSKHNNICVVGDEDQAIYRFRGATVRNILEFESHFDMCQKIVLSRNYRSHGGIVDFYNGWMGSTSIPNYEFEWGGCRHVKHIVASGNVIGSYPPVQKISGEGNTALTAKIVSTVKKLVGSGTVTNLNQIAFVFSSVKSQKVLDLQDALQDAGYPVYSPRSQRFFDRDEVKTALGILLEAFPEFKSRYFQGNFRKFATYMKEAAGSVENLVSRPEYSELKSCILEMASQIRTGEGKWTFSGMVYRMMACQPVKGFIDSSMARDISEQRPARNIAKLIEYLTMFEKRKKVYALNGKTLNGNLDSLFNYYLSPLYQSGIEEYEDEEVFAPSGKICFYTIHQAKGLEFPVVFCGLPVYGPRDSSSVLGMNRLFEANGGRPPFEPGKYVRFFDFWRSYYVAFSRAESILFLLNDSGADQTSRCFKSVLESVPECDSPPSINLKQVSDRKLTRSYAFTVDVNNYDMCQTRYCLERYIGFSEVPSAATSFGILEHSILEDINKAVLREGPEAVTPEFIQASGERNFKAIRSADHVPLGGTSLTSAIGQASLYAERMKDRWQDLHASEMAVSALHGDYLIEGKADLVLKCDGGYEIVDFKTGSRPDPIEDKFTYESVREQLRIYAFLLRERYGLDVRRLTAYYTGEGEGRNLIEFSCSPVEVAETVSKFDSIVGKIGDGEFSGKSKVKKYCKTCQFRYYCGHL